MKDYGELVREAIKKAHEDAEIALAAAEAQKPRFEVGKTYATSSICDHNCVFSYTIIKRTAKTVVIRDKFGDTRRCKLHNGYHGAECIYPQGVYSMCPVLDATDLVA